MDNTEYIEIPKDMKENDLIVKEKVLSKILERSETVKVSEEGGAIFEKGRTHFCSLIHVPEYREGVFSWEGGAIFPMKGYMYPEVCDTTHLVKRSIRLGIEIVIYKPFVILISPIFFLPVIKYQFLRHITDKWILWAHTMLKNYYIYPYRFCRSGRELYNKAIQFSENKKDKSLFQDLAKILVMLWEYDNSYRYRGQDLFGEFNKDSLKRNARREILRVLDIGIERELDGQRTGEGTYKKRKIIKHCIHIFSYVYPKIFKEFTEYLLTLDFDEVKLDEEDIYDCARRDLYNFQGSTIDVRLKERILKYHFNKKRTTITGVLPSQ